MGHDVHDMPMYFRPYGQRRQMPRVVMVYSVFIVFYHED